MGIKKQAVLIVVPFMMMACGESQESSSNAYSSSSLSSSSASSIAAKVLKLDFNENGCVTEHNADATTEFDAFGGQRKLFAWNCVQGKNLAEQNKKLNLVYGYDQIAGCYKKDSAASDLLYGSLSIETEADCEKSAIAILKPIYAVEILTFDVNTKPDSSSAVSFSFNYIWKNTGTLPLSQTRFQIKVEYADGEKQGQSVIIGSYYSKSFAFPYASLDSAYSHGIEYYSFENYKPNQLYNVTFSIQDYYGATLATVTKQVNGN